MNYLFSLENLSSVPALLSHQNPSDNTSRPCHSFCTVFFSKWPIIYATISLLCDFLFHFVVPILLNLGTLPCLVLIFFSYLKYGSASVEDDFYVFYCGDIRFLSLIHS